MAAGPTIYRTAGMSLPPNKPDKRTKRLWEKHRKRNQRSAQVPKRRSL